MINLVMAIVIESLYLFISYASANLIKDKVSGQPCRANRCLGLP
jgi:hypothetical protein